ncbi:hypothetical protein L6452_05022 [Arctium lappa]|uniref:Uncharacterized protein n=1 Tax=Arctium lappa TaxID=4217 RepID=A0ACB9EEV0_ARCLA|nr:hypothetical protein L6452_05022 [Arctium lappa]
MVIAQNLQKIDPKFDGAKRDWVAIYDECANVLYQEIDYNKEAANTELFARYRVAAKLGKGQSVKSLQGDYVAWKGVVPTVGAGLKSIWDAAVVFLVDGYGDRSHNFSMLSLLLPVVLLFAVVVNLDFDLDEVHVDLDVQVQYMKDFVQEHRHMKNVGDDLS